MEADRSFTQGLRYLMAARRCEAWCGDDETQSKLGRLALAYRERSNALMVGSGPMTGEETATGPLPEQGQTRAWLGARGCARI
jgi:hypothetical protein